VYKYLKNILSYQIAGDWWVIKGVNCGADPYPGGYDWYPCQHERFIYLEDKHQWINNVTYCGGKDNTCNTEFIVTVANVTLPMPGIMISRVIENSCKGIAWFFW
jgi:hypothetical protein